MLAWHPLTSRLAEASFLENGHKAQPEAEALDETRAWLDKRDVCLSV
jgi:hypothetical protein